MRLVTLVMASGPGFPGGSPEHRYEMEVALTADRRLDAVAWAESSVPWRARRFWPGQAPREGFLHHEAETGWSLRFPPPPGAAADAAPQALLRHAGQIRPGEHLTIQEPDGREYGWRVVGVEVPPGPVAPP
ncbi:hypothetical protein JYK14_01400 [Siccirubricoccus sp. KC 17139]|uniref:Uncharacterized protein n=1 Tax=Siccirubricoccus soli TaxID=2899147 RepID=A0ABT1D0M3_9PROT|nr:hypothetical protein [Siccirubricoccus soli]MCO6414835.1 hypothetical protein [Siccirubricoccus soli]MCP2680965.1 hypothetical protein [Siccirubricoccus soli]